MPIRNIAKIQAKVNSELQKVDFNILKKIYCFFFLCDHKFTLKLSSDFQGKTRIA